MRRIRSRRGAALVLVIWTIAVLSIFAINFAGEAYIQAKVNLYMRERVHVAHVTEAGLSLAETIILTYQSVPDVSEDEDFDELLEKDRWISEKRALKSGASKTAIGPIAVDDENPEGGAVYIEIEAIGGGDSGGPKININSLYSQGNQHYAEWWQGILSWANVPEEYGGERVWDTLVDSWCDWRDEDDTKTGDDGAEKDYYEDEYEDENYRPRNGEITDLKELAKVRGFRDWPAVLQGGTFVKAEEDASKSRKEEQITVRSLLDVLDIEGGEKINVNQASKDVLMTIPGIYHEDDPELTEEIANAIIEAHDNPDPRYVEETETGDFKNWNDLKERTEGQIGNEAQDYLSFEGGKGDGAQFRISVTGISQDITHTIVVTAMVKDSKVRYVKWREDP